jgi:hypothetical protein
MLGEELLKTDLHAIGKPIGVWWACAPQPVANTQICRSSSATTTATYRWMPSPATNRRSGRL